MSEFKARVGWNEPTPRLPALVALAKRYLIWSRNVKFDVDLRYTPVVRFLKQKQALLGTGLRILDAGSGPLGFAYCAGRECVGIDIAFPKSDMAPTPSGQRRVIGSVVSLPFRSGSFDLVTNMDTLEHLPPEDRPLAVKELLRVARRAVVLGVPCGARAAAYDRRAEKVERDRGQEPDWRREHTANGLPGSELDQLIITLASARGVTRVTIRPHEGLLGLRLRWRLGLLIPQSHPAYGIVMAPLYAIAGRFQVGPCYRRIYYMELA